MMIDPINPIKRDWLKELRKEKGLSTREIADIFGVSYQHYNDIETGRRNPSIALSLQMASFFNEPLESFLEERTKFKRRTFVEIKDELQNKLDELNELEKRD